MGERCGECGRALVPIVYGVVEPAIEAAAEQGAVVIGGCAIPVDGEVPPSQACPAGHGWDEDLLDESSG